uniref:SAYSvFN domain-containing protein n=1 Tax=Parastrongyloides trichosuri TaxID=131310 RepID=A0A0N4Z0H0_PARTI
MPLQEFQFVDYWGPVVVAAIFAVILFLLSFFIINWFCITKKDDFTVFEKLGKRYDVKLGPHDMTDIRRGGYASSIYKQREEAKMSLINIPEEH